MGGVRFGFGEAVRLPEAGALAPAISDVSLVGERFIFYLDFLFVFEMRGLINQGWYLV